jgi:cytidylate kinase
MYPYPENVGIIIPAVSSNNSKVSSIDLNRTIITIFGLPSTGKGTLSREVAKRLELPVFDTGLLYRVATYYFINSNLEVNPDNLVKFKNSIKIDLENNQILVLLDGLKLDDSQIRNPEIDTKIGLYAKQPPIRAVVDSLIAGFVLKSSFVTDGRGANDGYLLEAEKQGFKVVRVLLQAEQTERIRRRFVDYLALERGKEITATIVEKLWKTCEETVKLRDEEEIIKEKTLNLGMVTDQTGVLDTTQLGVSEAVEAVLGWLN